MNSSCTWICPHLPLAPAPSEETLGPADECMSKYVWECMSKTDECTVSDHRERKRACSHQFSDHGGPQWGEVLGWHAQQQHSEEQEHLSVEDGHLGQTQTLHQTLWTHRQSFFLFFFCSVDITCSWTNTVWQGCRSFCCFWKPSNVMRNCLSEWRCSCCCAEYQPSALVHEQHVCSLPCMSGRYFWYWSTSLL